MNEVNAWSVELPDGSILRQGDRHDRLMLGLLTATSRWVYESRASEDMTSLLTEQPGLVWLRDDRLLGALLSSMQRAPVAAIRRLVIRDGGMRPFFFDTVLSLAEARLYDLGARRLSIENCAEWLVRELSARGYHLQDDVVYYRHRLRAMPDSGGNRQVSIRPAVEGDLPAILAIDHAAFDGFWRLNEPLLRRGLGTETYMVAVWRGRVVGYLMAEMQGRLGYIGRLGVLPECQQRGIGTRLMVEALDRLRRVGVAEVVLNTQRGNHRSRLLYEKLGFNLTGMTDTFWARELTREEPVPLIEG
ncbi:MAG TPA: GNAT family N-acetyltransferase [Chloroflexi bacterium]|nr:GNAT family N-acetyltransferase [Chloroflexota bacterium]